MKRSHRLKFSVSALLVLIALAALTMLALRTGSRIQQTNEQIAELNTTVASNHRSYWIARQQVRLCTSVASFPAIDAMQHAEQNFQDLQQRYGSLQIDDPQSPAIVSIPTISFPHARAYAWKIYVPKNQPTEIAALVTDRSNQIFPETKLFEPAHFSGRLPTGESVILVHCDPITDELARPDQAMPLKVKIMCQGLQWETTYQPNATAPSIREKQFADPYRLFRSSRPATLLTVTHFRKGRSAEFLKLMLRPIDSTSRDSDNE
ncbi:MAG: hypothetical protein HKN47_27565 [Pirellulaceae bacterium]|nr:hypothetical protein [Pirellulaceae bacterium]